MKHLPNIQFKVIPHGNHRYETVGDYFEDKYMGGIDRVNFRVSEMKDDYEFGVFLHELCEWYLVKKHGIDVEAIDAFDMEYEKNRKKGDTSEPGDSPLAPYHKEHVIATSIEKLFLTKHLKVDWDAYDKFVCSL